MIPHQTAGRIFSNVSACLGALMRLLMRSAPRFRPPDQVPTQAQAHRGGEGVARAAGRWSHVGFTRREFSPKWAPSTTPGEP